VGGRTGARRDGLSSSALGSFYGCGVYQVGGRLSSRSWVCSLAGVVPRSVHVTVVSMTLVALGKFIFSQSKWVLTSNYLSRSGYLLHITIGGNDRG